MSSHADRPRSRWFAPLKSVRGRLALTAVGAMVACTSVLIGACNPVDNNGSALPILPDDRTTTEPPTTTDAPTTDTSASTLPTKTSTSATIGTTTPKPGGGGGGGGGGGVPAPGSPRGCGLPAFPTTS